MNSIADHLRSGAQSLNGCSDSPLLDAELLLAQVLRVSRSALIARGSDPVSDELQRIYADLLSRRLNGAPVAYLTGTREFWSLPLKVTPAVLVPRPETEVLVQLALTVLPHDQLRSVLDLGTGSGAIALAIASERPKVRITGVDVSQPALNVAMQNSTELRLSNIDWRLGSWFDAVPNERFDLIVANPPYVAATDPALANLSQEPSIALTPGATGLEALTVIAAGARPHLLEHGWLILEHGNDQANDVVKLLESFGFLRVRSHHDFSGKPRVTLGTVHTQH